MTGVPGAPTTLALDFRNTFGGWRALRRVTARARIAADLRHLVNEQEFGYSRGSSFGAGTVVTINAAWHERNVMPRNPTARERIAWHRAHQEHCGCRPIPAKLLEQMTGSR